MVHSDFHVGPSFDCMGITQGERGMNYRRAWEKILGFEKGMYIRFKRSEMKSWYYGVILEVYSDKAFPVLVKMNRKKNGRHLITAITKDAIVQVAGRRKDE
jgi:hypothetical protein